MKKHVMTWALLATMMAGCGEQMEVPAGSTHEQGTDKPVMADRVWNGRMNPYDSSGIRHNLVLEALRNHQQSTGDTTKAGMKDFLTREFQERVGRMPGIDLDKVDGMYRQVRKIGLSKFLSGTDLNDEVKEYFIRLEDITKSTTSEALFPSFLAEVTQLEQDVMESGLPQHDREAVLRVSSIAYHSGLFWKEVHDFDGWTHPSPDTALRWWQWPIVLHADFVGGVLGLVLGGDLHDMENAADWMSGGAEGVLGS